ncbi:type II toxin-antitoxin system Phd/YefM family antitoxin [Euhalothece natronophila Z-M001]|uniref:Antitoxin n=1 Tax=Euhalothece natronophila Z-M001 TaxID=522448 RepID=A0A5B8NJ36_9CHRO|nr:type II toxin-antitoxin system Phd/YefM family antitoxin [Euhalothece natronophila]QDZ38491.1 type II toxin-antitoxin system Phd/YefM family antitoxin [Euhalothece natronophila Z-M001]
MLETIDYTQIRENFAKVLDEIVQDGKVYAISRKGEQQAVLMSADDYSSLMTTLHLLRSRNNSSRLFEALEESENNDTPTQTLDELGEEMNFVQRETQKK